MGLRVGFGLSNGVFKSYFRVGLGFICSGKVQDLFRVDLRFIEGCFRVYLGLVEGLLELVWGLFGVGLGFFECFFLGCLRSIYGWLKVYLGLV